MKIELTSKTPNAQIRYTMDGTAPTEGSALYNEPFEIAGLPFTVRARAYADGLTPSRYTELAGKSPEEWEKISGSIFNGSSCPINSNTVTNGNVYVSIIGNYIYYSTDAFNWQGISTTINSLQSLGYVCGKFVVTTQRNKIYTSADGINWQEATVTISEATTNETGGGTIYYGRVGGNDARGFISCYNSSYTVCFCLTSTDGVNWVDTAGRTNKQITTFVYEKNILLAYTSSGYNVYRSVDNGQTFSLAYTFSSSGGIVYAGNYFYGLDSTKIYYSTDGETWEKISRSTFARKNVVYLNNKYFIVEGYGVAVSDDGLNWSFKTVDSKNQWFSYIGYINGVYVISDSSANTFVSTDLENWTALQNGYKFNAGMYTLAGKLWGAKGSGCRYTEDGYNWITTPFSIDGFDHIYSIAKGDNSYIVNSGGYGTYFSRDLVNFTKITEINGSGWAVIYDGGKYVASGTGKLFTSVDGVNWVTHTLSKSADIKHIAICNNMFIATGASGLLATSADGESWTVIDVGTTSEIGRACYANGIYIAPKNSGAILTSTDGINWEKVGGRTAHAMINVNGIYICLDYQGNNAYFGTDLYDMAGWTKLNFASECYTPVYRCLSSVGDEIFIGGGYGTLMKCELFKRSIEED